MGKVAAAVAALSATGLSAKEPLVSGRRIVERGSATGAPPCVSCHGKRLQGNEAMKAPALAGKQAEYIVMRLEHYAGPQGHNALMKQVATALTTSERQAVARYVAGLSAVSQP